MIARWCKRCTSGWALRVHRPRVLEREPAAGNAIDEPDADEAEGQPGDDQADAERHHDEQAAQAHPEGSEPECADLPAEVRVEPRSARVFALDVVHDDRDDRRPADQERSDDGRGAEDADEEAEPVQRVDDLCPLHERAIGCWRGIRHVAHHPFEPYDLAGAEVPAVPTFLSASTRPRIAPRVVAA